MDNTQGNEGGNEFSTSGEKFTDKERRELELKLDQELEDFIASRQKRESEIVPPDELEKELLNHPFFMKELPKDGKLPPLLEGLQQLKYSEKDNEPEELACAHKDDGNQAFKAANYRLAIMSYTEGLKTKCTNNQLNATLYNNRAASHFRLKNYRSCYNDCKSALEIDQNYVKALVRLAETCMELELYDECVQHCRKLELATGRTKEFIDMADKATKKKNDKARDERRKLFQDKKKDIGMQSLKNAIEARGIRLLNSELANLENPLLGASGCGVRLEEDKLVWPVVLLYPEYKMTEVIQNFHEDSTFEEQLAEVFAERPEWDEEKKYNLNSINIFFEGEDKEPHKVKMKSTLKSVLSLKSYTVDAATPAFIIFVKGSNAEKIFLDQSS